MEQEGQLQSGGVDDATRLAASARTLTLNPISNNIVPDDEPDDLVAARHTMSPPIANIPSDEEATSPPVSEHVLARKNHHLALSVSSVVVVVLTLATSYLFLSK